MKKTAKQVQGDIMKLLEDSQLVAGLSGKVYRGTEDDSYRPRDSRAEDLIVIFTTGLPNEVQTGVVTIQIYFSDIAPYDDGVMVEDGKRGAELEAAAAEWVESLTCDRSCYRFQLQQTIHTQANHDINQHFVVVKLGYYYYGD